MFKDTVIKPVSGPLNQDQATTLNFANSGVNFNSNNASLSDSGPGVSRPSSLSSQVSGNSMTHGLGFSYVAKSTDGTTAQSYTTQSLSESASKNSSTGGWGVSGAKTLAEQGTYSSVAAANARDFNPIGGNNFVNNGIPGSGNKGFSGIPNDGKVDPLYNSKNHTAAENQAISDMMTMALSSSSSQTSKADSVNGEQFTAAFSTSIESGNSLQDTIRSLDGKEYGNNQTSQAYNTDNMSRDISISNKAPEGSTAIILRGSDAGVSTMMAKDHQNLVAAYESMGFKVEVATSEKEFEQKLMEAKSRAEQQNQTNQENGGGEKPILATHVISHGLQTGGSGKNDEDAHGALAMKGGGLYHEKDMIGDIAGALAPGENGESAFGHSYNSITACHSGAFDNKQALQENNGQTGSSAGLAATGGADKKDSVAFSFGQAEAPQQQKQEDKPREPVAA